MILEVIFWSALFLILHTYCFYPLVVWMLSLFFPAKWRKEERFFPSVSMLISAYNEEKVIEQKLQNCLALAYPRNKFEVLIGSDGSTDRTCEIARRFQNDHIHLFEFSERGGKASVLNRLAAQAHGDILIFSDANTMYQPEAIQKMVRHLNDPTVGGVCGRLILLDAAPHHLSNEEGVYWRYETYIKMLEGRLGNVIGANGGIYAIRRELYLPLPTHKRISDDLAIALNVIKHRLKMVYEENAVAIEYLTGDANREFPRRITVAGGAFHTLSALIPLLNPLRGFAAFALWSHKIIRWFVPFFVILAFVLNIILLGRSDVYWIPLIVQSAVYLCALLGLIGRFVNIHVRLFSLCYYFVMMHVALFIGFFKFVFGLYRPTWQTSERT